MQCACLAKFINRWSISRRLSNGECIGKKLSFICSYCKLIFRLHLSNGWTVQYGNVVCNFTRQQRLHFVFLCVLQDAFRAISGTDEAKNALSLIQVYFNNIVKDPRNQKFRRIRISKFYLQFWKV